MFSILFKNKGIPGGGVVFKENPPPERHKVPGHRLPHIPRAVEQPIATLSVGEQVGFADIVGGTAGCVELLAAEEFSYPLAKGEDPRIVLSPQSFSYAPVREGGEEGCAYALLDGAVIGQIPLVWGGSLDEKQEKERTWLTRLFGGI